MGREYTSMTMKRLGGLAIVIGRRCACLVASKRWCTRTGVSLPPHAHQLRVERGLPSVRIVRTRKRELAIVISTVGRGFGRREREKTLPRRTSDDETRGEAEERKRMRGERESERGREVEREREENIVVAMVIWPHPMEPANELSTDRRST